MLELLLSHISVQDVIWLIVALPLAGFLINGVVSLISVQYSLSEPRSLVVTISQVAALLSFGCVILVWYILYGLEGASPSAITGPLINWKGFLNQPLAFGLKADQLSLSIAFITAFVGVATHIYSVGFMAAEKRVAGYLSLLNLIYASALLLVLTDSFFLFFVVWQILGVVGFVFIGGYFTDPECIRSATVYYIIEMISGAAFLLVMILVWKAFLGHADLNIDILQFTSIQLGSSLLLPYADVICFALLVSVIARSLQFPLYVWIAGAIKVQPPVFSFLFVVCSVLLSTYLLIRLNFLLVLSPRVLAVIAILGGIGCVFGSVAAIVQKEARKVIAYFVISQAGLAFIGIGVGAFAAAVFHVFTYAVYASSLLFGVGGVVATVGHDLMDRLSGLRRYLPVTFWAIIVGLLAAVGIYPLSGFYSRNGIIWEAYQRGHGILFLCAFVSGIFAAIALFRMVALIFFGRPERSKPEAKPFEETSVSMLVVMVVVGFASIVAGWFGVSEAFGGKNLFGEWLTPGLATQMVHVIGGAGRFSEVVIAVITTLCVAHAGLVTWIIYVQKRGWPLALAQRYKRIHALLENGFYLNDLYRVALVRPLAYLSRWLLWEGLDRLIIDGVIVGGIGRVVRLKGEILERLKAEEAAAYLFWIVVVLIVLVGWSVV